MGRMEDGVDPVIDPKTPAEAAAAVLRACEGGITLSGLLDAMRIRTTMSDLLELLDHWVNKGAIKRTLIDGGRSVYHLLDEDRLNTQTSKSSSADSSTTRGTTLAAQILKSPDKRPAKTAKKASRRLAPPGVTRARIVAALELKPCKCADLARELQMTYDAISFHLRRMATEGVLRKPGADKLWRLAEPKRDSSSAPAVSAKASTKVSEPPPAEAERKVDDTTTHRPSSLHARPKANDVQVGGDHYRSKSIQPWDAMSAWMQPEQFRGFLRGNAIKYLARTDDKGGVEDLRKARHYLDKLIEDVEGGPATKGEAG